MTRAASAAATRRALLDDAAELLNTGGTDAVTLREFDSAAKTGALVCIGQFLLLTVWFVQMVILT